jgi:hypothetical protein
VRAFAPFAETPPGHVGGIRPAPAAAGPHPLGIGLRSASGAPRSVRGRTRDQFRHAHRRGWQRAPDARVPGCWRDVRATPACPTVNA